MNQENEMDKKLHEWLRKEGYPTEFLTANIFNENGFRVFQGYHIRDKENEKAREIDVLANIDIQTASKSFMRVSHVVECKWSQEKPWIVFTSENARMSVSACIAQSIGTDLATAILWMLSGDPAVNASTLFNTPERAGFSGRQAFSSGNDHFYNAMKSVVDLSVGLVADYYHDLNRADGDVPKSAIFVFPVIVVNGRLFEAYFDRSIGDVRIEERQSLRCHWRGSASWNLHATIDIVTMEGLQNFVTERTLHTKKILTIFEKCRQRIARSIQKKDLDLLLNITPASRGVIGMPKILQEAIDRIKKPS